MKLNLQRNMNMRELNKLLKVERDFMYACGPLNVAARWEETHMLEFRKCWSIYEWTLHFTSITV